MKDDDNLKKPVAVEKEGSGELVLTTREMYCITQALQGKNILHIAKDMKITPNTIFYYLNSIQLKIYRLSQQVIQLTDTQLK